MKRNAKPEEQESVCERGGRSEGKWEAITRVRLMVTFTRNVAAIFPYVFLSGRGSSHLFAAWDFTHRLNSQESVKGIEPTAPPPPAAIGL